ncbi:MAG: hypothetical protein ABIG71_03360 [Candidatus Uhrbacteria bacterium]
MGAKDHLELLQGFDGECVSTRDMQRAIREMDRSVLMQASPDHARRLKEALWRASAIPQLSEPTGEMIRAVADVTRIRATECGRRTRGAFRVTAHAIGVQDILVSGTIESDGELE